MALPPTIPTSFVPRPQGGSGRSAHIDFIGALSYVSYFILAIAFLSALGVFAYGHILSSELERKDAALAAAESQIDPATVESFVRLRDRLSSGKTLLDKHAAFSSFFAALEKLLPGSVRFSALHLSLDPTGKAKLEGSGSAKSFNALAAASNAFSADGRIKDAIFSNISVASSGVVSFSLAATIDPKLLVFAPATKLPVEPPSLPATTTTP